jgi:hypothetical protein
MRQCWSDSKLADWIRGMTSLSIFSTTEEQEAWERSAKQRKFRFWLAEVGFNRIQDLIYWPIKNRLDDIKLYIRNRWVTQTHHLSSNLQKGDWHEYDDRLLHSAFDSYVDFVEREKAWFHHWPCMDCPDIAKNKYWTPWFGAISRLVQRSSPEDAQKYREWAVNLGYHGDIGKADPDNRTLTQKDLVAEEAVILYLWWKEDRPRRPESQDILGELADEEEDTAMLVRLVKIRGALWT